MSKKYISQENLQTFKEELDSSFATKEQVEEKQDSLEFNPTVPAGITPNPLSVLKSDDDYYKIKDDRVKVIDKTFGSYTDNTYIEWTEEEKQILQLHKDYTIILNLNNNYETYTFLRSYSYQTHQFSWHPNFSSLSISSDGSKYGGWFRWITSDNGNGFRIREKIIYFPLDITFNPTIPSGTTPTELINIKNGNNYYSLPQSTQILELITNSGTLTDEQYEKLSGENTKILHNTEYYEKAYVDNSYIMYYRNSVYVQGGLGKYAYAMITKSTKAYYFSESSLPQGTTVEANPALVGSEANLTALKIGNTKYKLAASISPETLASLYDNTATYSVGDYVIYNNVLYVCNTAVSTAEDFDSNKWSEIKVTAVNNEDDIEKITVSNDQVLTESQFNKMLRGKLLLEYNGVACIFTGQINPGEYILEPYKNIGGFMSGGANQFPYGLVLYYGVIRVFPDSRKVRIGDKWGERLPSFQIAVLDASENSINTTNLLDISDNTIKKKIIRVQNLRKTQDMICQDYYDATATYNVGDIVIYQNNLYKCNTAITVAEAWDSTHWTQVSVKSLLLNSEVQIVEVSGASGTLSASELEKVQAYNCLLKRGTTLFYKASDNTSIVYKAMQHDISGGKVAEDYISISNVGYWEYNNTSNIEFEANPTIPSGTAVNSLSNVKVGTSYYSVGGTPEVLAYEGTSLLTADFIFENWTLHRAIKDGNILWLVVAGSITNNSSSAQTSDGICEITLPTEIASKIYRDDGVPVSQPKNTGHQTVLSYPCTVDDQTKYAKIYSFEENTICIMIPDIMYYVGTPRRVDMRIPIFLDIGTVQQ